MQFFSANKGLAKICLTHLMLEIFFLTQVALIPVYVSEFNINLIEASMVVTVQSVVTLIMNIPIGYFADRINTNRLLSASMMIQGLSALFLSQAKTFWMIILGTAIMRISSPMYHISGLSQISKIMKRDRMSSSMGIHNAFGNLGSAIGTLSLSLFISTIGWRWLYISWSIPIISWGLILLRSPELEALKGKKDETTKIKIDGGNKRLSDVLSTGFIIFLIVISARELGTVGISTFMTTFLVEVRDLTKSLASLIFGLGPFIGIVGSLNGGYLGNKFGAKKALSFVILCSTLLVSLLAISSKVEMLILIYVLYSFFNSSVWTPINTIVADIVPITKRGTGFSIYFFTESLLRSITPLIAALIIEFYNIFYIFPFSAIFLVLSLIVLQRLQNR
jgi:FSR family fosmidomycin resistance protein-like MFS transporter